MHTSETGQAPANEAPYRYHVTALVLLGISGGLLIASQAERVLAPTLGSNLLIAGGAFFAMSLVTAWLGDWKYRQGTRSTPASPTIASQGDVT